MKKHTLKLLVMAVLRFLRVEARRLPGASLMRNVVKLLIFCFIPSVAAFSQSSTGTPVQPSRLVVYESFAGDSNADGQVMALSSSATYYFTDHFSARAGVPIYFDHISSSLSSATTPAPTSTFSSGIGDIFVTMRAAWKPPLLNYATTLTGTAPTGEQSRGFSTGHFTFDWSNRFDRSFGILTPFVGVGLANSVIDTPYFMRPFTTLGPLAHFEGGAEVKLSNSVNVTISGYDIAPWGTQTLISRVITGSATGKTGSANPKRQFENSHQTTGTAALTKDDGFSAGIVFSPKSYLDLSAAYTRSAQYALDSVSFGIGVNVTALLGKTLRP